MSDELKTSVIASLQRSYETAEDKFLEALQAKLDERTTERLRLSATNAYAALSSARAKCLKPEKFPLDTYLADLKNANDAVDKVATTVATATTVADTVVKMVSLALQIAGVVSGAAFL